MTEKISMADLVKLVLSGGEEMTLQMIIKEIYSKHKDQIKTRYRTGKILNSAVRNALTTVPAFNKSSRKNDQKRRGKFWYYDPTKSMKRNNYRKKTDPFLWIKPPKDPEEFFLWYDRENILFGN